MRRKRRFNCLNLEDRLTPTGNPFTIVALPDTQHYAQYANLNYIFLAQTQWIVDNRDAHNIAFVTGLGDIVQHGNNATQWTVADAAYDLLDGNLQANPQGVVPYSVALGNHDYNTTNDRSTGAPLYIQHFSSQRFAGRDWYGGDYLEKNHYQFFNAGGYTFLHITIEWEATDDVIDWARQVVRANPGLPTILSTHSYVYDVSESRRIVRQSADGNSGEAIYNKLVYDNPQIFMVLNGHFHSSAVAWGGEYQQTSYNAAGLPVFEMLSDYQERPGQDSGLLRLLRFDPAANQIQVKTYSPTQNIYETDANSQFTYQVDFAARFSANGPDPVRVAAFQEGVDWGFGPYFGTQDTQLREATPTTSFGDNTEDLLVDFPSAGSTNGSQVLLRFDNIFGSGSGQVPVGARILSATLTVDSNNPGAGARLHRMLSPWSESSTWSSLANGVQTNGAEANASFHSQVGFSELSPLALELNQLAINVTDDVAAWAAGETNRGWALLPWTNGTDGWAFAPSESVTPAWRPRLRIEWLPATSIPTEKTLIFKNGLGGATAADTYIAQVAPTTSYESAPKFYSDFPDAGNEQTALLRFDNLFGNGAGQIRVDATIEAAYLYLTTPYHDVNAEGGGSHMARMLQPWPTNATWSGAFGGNGIQMDGVEARLIPDRNTGSVDFGVMRINVAESLRAWQAGEPNYGWVFIGNNTDGWQVASSESAALADRPRLVVMANNRPPRVNAIEVNQGDVQRSRVTSLTVSFSTSVFGPGGTTIPTSAFELQRADGAVANFMLSSQVVNGRSEVTIGNFTGLATEFGSLGNGRWTLRVRGFMANADGQFLDGNNDGTGGDDHAFAFHRLFGDADGNAFITATDFAAFRLVYGQGPSIFDFDNNGQTTAADFAEFRLVYGMTV